MYIMFNLGKFSTWRVFHVVTILIKIFYVYLLSYCMETGDVDVKHIHINSDV